MSTLVKEVGTAFNREETIKAKKTVTVKMEVDGKEHIQEFEGSDIVTFVCNEEGETSINIKSDRVSMVHFVTKLILETPEVFHLAMMNIVNEDKQCKQ